MSFLGKRKLDTLQLQASDDEMTDNDTNGNFDSRRFLANFWPTQHDRITKLDTVILC